MKPEQLACNVGHTSRSMSIRIHTRTRTRTHAKSRFQFTLTQRLRISHHGEFLGRRPKAESPRSAKVSHLGRESVLFRRSDVLKFTPSRQLRAETHSGRKPIDNILLSPAEGSGGHVEEATLSARRTRRDSPEGNRAVPPRSAVRIQYRAHA